MAGRILIADKVATNRIALKAVAAGARHEALDAATPEDVLAAVREHGLELVILDGDLDTSVSPSTRRC